MFKQITKPVTLLIIIVVLSSLLTISASGSFFYRHAVLGYETQKSLLLNLNLSYTYLLNSLQETSKKYILTGNPNSKKEFFQLVDDYSKNNSIDLNFDPISDHQASIWISDEFVAEKSNLNSISSHLGFKGEELSNYSAFVYSFKQIVLHLSDSVEARDQNIFTNALYAENWHQFNFYMLQFTTPYMNRLNDAEDKALNMQNIFGILTLLFSLSLATVGAFVGYFTVITNRHNSYYHKLFSATVDTADFGLAILNRDFTYKYVNHQYKEILNLNEPNFLGKTPLELLPKDVTDIICKPTDWEDGLVNSTFPVTIATTLRYLNASRFPVKDENDQINYVSIIRDFTDLIHMENQLKDQLAEIEFHSKAKDTFMNNVSHEIKTPLNAIIGLSYMLNDTELSTKQKGIVTRITSASNLLLNLINDVLDLSKIKNADFRLYPTDVLLTNLLSEIEGIATALIGEKNVLWQTDYDYNPSLCLHIDKTRLSQVILNLVNNACKFTNEGSIKLSVNTVEEDSETVVLKFSILDTGLGMEQEDLERIFQEFEQLENYLTKKHRGNGLGLIISKNIIQSLGGEIWVTSKKDVGSEFSFVIPVVKTSPETLRANLDLDAVPVLDGNGKRVLVVEDNEINYEVTASILSKSNIHCENAPDGEIAISMCKNAPENYYQLILMDIHMPKMDGYTASKILKNEMKISTPIIALTATNVDCQTLLEYKGIIEGYIPKPFNYYDLLARIAPYINSSAEFTLERRKNLTARMEDPFSGRVTAIENLGGMEDLYEKHLLKFKSNYADFPATIEGLLKDGNREEARRLVHSVKGLAGTLGLPYLQKISADFEEAILLASMDYEPLLIEFKKRLDDVCQN